MREKGGREKVKKKSSGKGGGQCRDVGKTKTDSKMNVREE